jgi:hypothetical protein
VRTISQVGDLFDVCLATSGAYPDIDTQLTPNTRTYAASLGLIPDVELEPARAQASALHH